MQNRSLLGVIGYKVPCNEKSDYPTGDKLSHRRKQVQQRGDSACRRGQQQKPDNQVIAPMLIRESLIVTNKPRHIQEFLPNGIPCLFGNHIVLLA